MRHCSEFAGYRCIVGNVVLVRAKHKQAAVACRPVLILIKYHPGGQDNSFSGRIWPAGLDFDTPVIDRTLEILSPHNRVWEAKGRHAFWAFSRLWVSHCETVSFSLKLKHSVQNKGALSLCAYTHLCGCVCFVYVCTSVNAFVEQIV